MAFDRWLIAGFGAALVFQAATAKVSRDVEETCAAYPEAPRLGPILKGRPHLDVRMRQTAETGADYFDVRGCGKNGALRAKLGPLAETNVHAYNALPLYHNGDFDLFAWDGDTEYEAIYVYPKSSGYRRAFTVTGAWFEIADADKDGVYEIQVSGMGDSLTITCTAGRGRKIFLKDGHKLVLKAAQACANK